MTGYAQPIDGDPFAPAAPMPSGRAVQVEHDPFADFSDVQSGGESAALSPAPGYGELAKRGLVQGGASLLRALDFANSANPLQLGLNAALSRAGIDAHPMQTAATNADEYAAAPRNEAEPGLAGKVIQGTTRVVPELAAVIGTGGEAAVPEGLSAAARAVPYAGRFLEGITRGLPAAAEFTGIQSANLPDNLTPAQKAIATAKNFGLNALMAGIPVAAGTSPFVRIPTGAAIGAGQSAAMSALTGQQQDAAGNIVGALTGAGFGAMPHGAAPEASIPDRAPLPGKSAQEQALDAQAAPQAQGNVVQSPQAVSPALQRLADTLGIKPEELSHGQDSNPANQASTGGGDQADQSGAAGGVHPAGTDGSVLGEGGQPGGGETQPGVRNAGQEPAGEAAAGNVATELEQPHNAPLARATGEFQKATEPTGNNVTDALSAKLRSDLPKAVEEYTALPDSRDGTVLNTDVARELSPEYREDRTKSADVHEPASAFIKLLYAQKLSEPTPEGKDPVVLFTAGGTGAGKTTSQDMFAREIGNPEIVYDTNMNTFESSLGKVRAALRAGRDVKIVFTYRDPVDALRGALGRASRMERESGTGRTVPLDKHADTHIGAADVIQRLAKKFKNDQRVEILAADNSYGKNNARPLDIAKIPDLGENTLHERLAEELERAHAAGEISDAVYRGFKGRDSGGESEALPGTPSAGSGRPGRVVQEGPQGVQREDEQAGSGVAPLSSSAADHPKPLLPVATSDGEQVQPVRNLSDQRNLLKGGDAATVAAVKQLPDILRSASRDPDGNLRARVNIDGAPHDVTLETTARKGLPAYVTKINVEPAQGERNGSGSGNGRNADGGLGDDGTTAPAGGGAAGGRDAAGRNHDLGAEPQRGREDVQQRDAGTERLGHDQEVAESQSTEQGGSVMQNRDRSRAASVQQMASIANHPDASRLSFSRDPNTGAPMVSAHDAERAISESDMGRRDHVTMADGEKVPVRYAVVDASDVQASHNADGTANPDYAGANLKALNNGRVAGLKSAYAKGEPGESYKVGLHDETELTGVSSKAIASKKNPVLIRLYDAQHNKGDMGARSNAEQALGQSATEKAYADARALPDLSDLPITESGELSTSPANPFYRNFLRNLGANEAAKLVDGNGQPNKQFFDRVRAAVFAKAYGNERMLSAMAEDAHPDARNVLNALVKAAPEWALVDHNGPLGDIPKDIGAAFDVMRQARESEQPVDEFLKQGDLIARDRGGDEWASFFARNARSSTKMAEGLREAARITKDEQAQADQGQMFARVPATRDDVFRRATEAVEGSQHEGRQEDLGLTRSARASRSPQDGARADQGGGGGGEQGGQRGTDAGGERRTGTTGRDESGSNGAVNALRDIPPDSSGTITQLRRELRTDPRIGNELGVLEEHGALHLIDDRAQRFAGRFDGRKLILNAAYLPHGDGLGTALHEVVHAEIADAGGMRAFVGPGEFDRLQRRLDVMKSEGGAAAELVKEAEARAAKSGETGARLDQERLTYFTQAARDAQTAGTLPTKAALVYRQVVAAIRAAFYNSRLGTWLRANGHSLKLTPDDFVALAEQAARRQARAVARSDGGNESLVMQPANSRPRDTASGDLFGGDTAPREESTPAPRASTGDLFGGATARDHVDAAVRAKDEALRGSGAAPTMRQGEGELFAGTRPEQTSIEKPFDSIPAEHATGATRDELPPERRRVLDMIPESIRRPLGDIADEVQKGVAPMASGSDAARAAAKDFANESRLAVHQCVEADKYLQQNFTREQQEKMWRAADEQSVLMQRGEDTKGRGLDTLAPDERAAVELMQQHANVVFDKAHALGMVEGEGLPSYVPRMVVEMGASGARRVGANANKPGASGVGANLKTSAGALKQRKHQTIEETVAAAKAKFGDEAEVVSNIRTLPLATRQLGEAIAGRSLINQVKELGRAAGRDNVHEGSAPANEKDQWFTIDHPAFKTWRPKFDDEGNVVKGTDGEPQFEQVPLYVHKDFEGPLKAVLSPGKDGAIYSALMAAKAKSMSLIMYSPIIHNAVEWGRALPAMPGKVLTFRVYFDGNKAKNDPATMREAINAGLAPIGGHGGMNDITGIADDRQIAPGRSLTAKAIGTVVDKLISSAAGTKVRETIDKMGDVWHNTLLWDRVGDLQMGLYTNLRDSMIGKGMDPLTAQRMAAHMANRYAGALPKEAMSAAARKVSNLLLFSRSFTFGNLGAMKDAVTGLPKDVQSQILRDAGELANKNAVSFARRKAIATIALDIGLMYLSNSMLQSSIAMVSGRSDLEKEEQGYWRRLQGLMQRAKERPLEMLNAFHDLNSLTPQGENEPGKQDRVMVGHMADGTAIYMRNPAGKIGEEFQGWLTSPLEMLKKKLGTFARPAYQTITNDVGFGRKLYDPNAEGISGAMSNIGKIVTNFIGDQVPLGALKAAKDYHDGVGDPNYNLAQVVGPLAGFTFSKGAPGGPAVGEMYAARERHDYEVQQTLPGIRKMIQSGDVDGARAKMKDIGISPSLQKYYIRTTQQPEQRLSKSQLKKFGSYANEEELQNMARFRGEHDAEGERASSGQ